MNICYVANVNSPHLKEWIELLEVGTQITFATIESNIDEEKLCQNRVTIENIITLPSLMRKLPKQLQYIILGIIIRFNKEKNLIVHAHNASGYGLTAAISGKKYLLTTYGSEIFHASNKSKLYNLLLKFSLNRAVKLTATTQVMQDQLEQDHSIPARKVDMFSLGVSDQFFKNSISEKTWDDEQGPIWFSNRRILPLYRITDIVQAFIAFKTNGGKGSLILLQGDADGPYFEDVSSMIADREDIRLVKGFVDTDTIIKLLDESHFTISMPMTDQLSSSLLEPMARKCVPIAAAIDAYSILGDTIIKVSVSENIVQSLEAVFLSSSNMNYNDYTMQSKQCYDMVYKEFSRSIARNAYANILNFIQTKY